MSRFKNLGNFVRLARANSKLSQLELAKLMSVRQSTISLWETGRRQPTTKKIKVLLEILKIEKGEFLQALMRDHSRSIFQNFFH